MISVIPWRISYSAKHFIFTISTIQYFIAHLVETYLKTVVTCKICIRSVLPKNDFVMDTGVLIFEILEFPQRKRFVLSFSFLHAMTKTTYLKNSKRIDLMFCLHSDFYYLMNNCLHQFYFQF